MATLWGVMSANVIWLPIGSRLKRLGELEAARMELTIEGIAAIQSGTNPRIVAQKLRSLLPEHEQARTRRPDMSGDASARQRSPRSTSTTSGGWSPTPTWSRCSWCCSS